MSDSVPRECPAMAHYPDRAAEGTGTTLVAVEFADGVVVGSDSCTSAGSYIVSRTTDKLTRVTDRLYVLRSGSAADSQAIADVVAYRMQILKYSEQGGKEVSVQRAAQLFRQYCYDYRDELSCSLLVAGHDDQLGGQVYVVPLGGMVMRQRAAASGSGSTFIQGFLDANWKEAMAQEDAEQLVLKAVSLAMERDGSSGGVAHVGALTAGGMRRNVFAMDDDSLPTWHYPKGFEEAANV